MPRIGVPTLLVATAVLALGSAACGGTSTVASSSSAPSTPIVSAAPASPKPIPAKCPTGAKIGSALGRTLGAPIQRAATGLSPGAVGYSCEYVGTGASLVLIDLGSGVNAPSALGATETAMQKAAAARGGTVTFTEVSGVGSKATVFEFHVSGTTENGILASLGSSYATITATPAATTPQLEALANDLL